MFQEGICTVEECKKFKLLRTSQKLSFTERFVGFHLIDKNTCAGIIQLYWRWIS